MPALLSPRLAGLALAAVLALGAPAKAAPLALNTDDEVAALADRVRAYAHASLVRWTIVAATRAEAEAKVQAVLDHLSSSDRALLLSRLLAQGGGEGSGAQAFISPQIGSTGGGACSWQVWVSDPELPAAEGQTAMVPLASHDRLPVGPKATFRVGHFGLVQSKLYAFDETRPGAIRDLATASDADIPVPSGGEDYIVLATARKSAPFLEGIKTALAASQGERRELGPEFALRERLLGAGRGIGANIEAVPSSMISRKSTKVASANAARPSEPDEPLMETCLYALTPER